MKILTDCFVFNLRKSADRLKLPAHFSYAQSESRRFRSRNHSGPEVGQVDRDGIERGNPDLIIAPEDSKRQPVPLRRGIGLEGMRLGVYELGVTSPEACVYRQLLRAIDAPGGWRQDLAHPVRYDLESMSLGQPRHVRFSPSGKVWDLDLADKMDLRLVDDPPAARPVHPARGYRGLRYRFRDASWPVREDRSATVACGAAPG